MVKCCCVDTASPHGLISTVYESSNQRSLGVEVVKSIHSVDNILWLACMASSGLSNL